METKEQHDGRHLEPVWLPEAAFHPGQPTPLSLHCYVKKKQTRQSALLGPWHFFGFPH